MKQQLKSALHKKTKSRYKTSAKYAHQGLLTIHNGSADKQDGKFAFIASDSFLSSYEWRKIRMEALKKYGSKCQCCGASPSTGAVMNVDHIKPRKLFPLLGLCLDNLQVLCHECNHGKGNWDMTDWRTNDYYIKLPNI
jgi:hypothetical protein